MKSPTSDCPSTGTNDQDCASAEARLIERLGARICLMPHDFVRGHAVGPYRLRLYCPAARLAFEIEACAPRDAMRSSGLERTDATTLRQMAQDSFLQSVGIEVLRVHEDEIKSNPDLEALVERIARRIERRMRAQRESGRRKQLSIGDQALASGSSLA